MPHGQDSGTASLRKLNRRRLKFPIPERGFVFAILRILCLQNTIYTILGILNRYGRFDAYDMFIKYIDNYIKWYNEKRIKITLGYLSPKDYRSLHLEAA